jgi:hypothetical protein
MTRIAPSPPVKNTTYFAIAPDDLLAICDPVAALEALLSTLGGQLMATLNDDELAQRFHRLCDRLHALEAAEGEL